MNIRKMKMKDYEQVYALWLSTPNTCFVAEKENKIIGVILSGHDGRRGIIHHTAVLGEEQRKGIGEALLNAAINALKGEGIHKVLLVVFDKNEKGNVFWEKHGFTKRNDLVYRNRAISELKRIDT